MHDPTHHGSAAGPRPVGADPHAARVKAVAAAARFHGVELELDQLGPSAGAASTTEDLLVWARAGGLQARESRLNWRRLRKLGGTGPVVLLLNDGGAALMMRGDKPRNIVWVRDPSIPRDQDGVPVDELRLRQVWSGEALLISRRETSPADARLGLGYLVRLVAQEGRLMRDVLAASVVLSFLAIPAGSRGGVGNAARLRPAAHHQRPWHARGRQAQCDDVCPDTWPAARLL